MSDITDIAGRYTSSAAQTAAAEAKGLKVQKKGSNSLDMNDFLLLMVQQFQNQTMDNAASTTDMMNQLVQMSVVQAVTNITDATTLMYAGSLVGKEVTVAGRVNSDGKYEEIVGKVTATGTLNGEQVIFIGDKSYGLSEIMAIGKLPEIKPPEPPELPKPPVEPVDPEMSVDPDKDGEDDTSKAVG